MNFSFYSLIATGKMLPFVILIQIGFLIYAILIYFRKKNIDRAYVIFFSLQSSIIVALVIHYNNLILNFKDLLFHSKWLDAGEILSISNSWLAFFSYEFVVGFLSFLFFFIIFILRKVK